MSLDLAACSDGELAALTLGGRHAAFAEIMRRHREPIYRLIRAHFGDAEEALDVAQNRFAAAFQNLARYDSDQPLRAWLARIAINKSRGLAPATRRTPRTPDIPLRFGSANGDDGELHRHCARSRRDGRRPPRRRWQ